MNVRMSEEVRAGQLWIWPHHDEMLVFGITAPSLAFLPTEQVCTLWQIA